MDENVKLIFRKILSEYPLNIIEREDGRRQVLKEINTQRTIEEINTDANKAPEIVPRFEAVKFKDGNTGLLIDWIDGRRPSTPEEISLCTKYAEQNLSSVIKYDPSWSGNFSILEDAGSENGYRIYYVDGDVPERIAVEGYQKQDFK